MGRIYRSAMGKQVDLDRLQSINEHTIAVGNMGVNAKGDQLGPGGKIVKTRDQVMKEYYALSGQSATISPSVTPKPIATSRPPTPPQAPRQSAQPLAPATQPNTTVNPQPMVQEPIVEQTVLSNIEPEVNSLTESTDTVLDSKQSEPTTRIPQPQGQSVERPMRGGLASSVASKESVTTQTLMTPPKKTTGIQRF
jgi:hypothetical protein